MDALRRALAVADTGERAALVTVIRIAGSTPRHLGAKMIVCENGNTINTIGGGRVEQEITAAGREVAAGAPPRRVTHHLVRDLAMCCGGSMEFYIEPVAPSAAALREALALAEARRPGLLITPLGGGPKRVDPIGEFRGRAAKLEADRFVEPVWPADRVILFGAGHVAGAIGPLAAQVGFEVVACDDDDTGALGRASWAARAVDSFEIREVERALGGLGPGDFVLIVTRDHAIDQKLLEALLPRAELGYLGLIGSAGKIGRFRKRLEARGLGAPELWARLHAPIGLDIAAETPEEIAVSVVAELIAVRNKGRA